MDASEREFTRLLRQSGPFQSELSAMVLAFTHSMRPEVSAMAREMMICAYAVYREHAESVRSASEAAVVAQWELSRRRISELEVLVDAGESVESLLVDHPQPALMATVLGVVLDIDPSEDDELLGEPEHEGPELADDEIWHLLAVMHTVLGVLESHATHRQAS